MFRLVFKLPGHVAVFELPREFLKDSTLEIKTGFGNVQEEKEPESERHRIEIVNL